jgi:predicted ATP-dependent serine protease
MSTKFITAAEVAISNEFFERIQTGVESFDALFGEGLLPGSVLTLSAKHGTGKTQFCLQLLQSLSSQYAVGYVSNEESTEQLAFTCKRINTFNVPIANISTVSDVASIIPDLDVLVVDSFSKLKAEGINSSRKLEQYALDTIIGEAKKHKCVVLLITHNTKSGQSRGSSLVQHDVDATLYIEKSEDDPELRRIFFDKNRFGAPNEIYLQMTASGYSLELKEAPAEDQEHKPSTNKTQERYEKICEHLSVCGASFASEVASAIELDYGKTMVLLRELRNMGKITKTGRAEEAVYAMVETAQELIYN